MPFFWRRGKQTPVFGFFTIRTVKGPLDRSDNGSTGAGKRLENQQKLEPPAGPEGESRYDKSTTGNFDEALQP